jgi:hypothetical protein
MVRKPFQIRLNLISLVLIIMNDFHISSVKQLDCNVNY